jgi:hypothetical protein
MSGPCFYRGFFVLSTMPIIEVPIEFEYEGVLFQGCFYTSKGVENVWQLSLSKYAYGQLVKYNTGWKWCPNAKNLFTEDYMLEFFVKTVNGHRQKHPDE